MRRKDGDRPAQPEKIPDAHLVQSVDFAHHRRLLEVRPLLDAFILEPDNTATNAKKTPRMPGGREGGREEGNWQSSKEGRKEEGSEYGGFWSLANAIFRKGLGCKTMDSSCPIPRRYTRWGVCGQKGPSHGYTRRLLKGSTFWCSVTHDCCLHYEAHMGLQEALYTTPRALSAVNLMFIPQNDCGLCSLFPLQHDRLHKFCPQNQGTGGGYKSLQHGYLWCTCRVCCRAMFYLVKSSVAI